MGCSLKIVEKVITVVSNMEDSTMKVNQNGVLTVAKNKAAEKHQWQQV